MVHGKVLNKTHILEILADFDLIGLLKVICLEEVQARLCL